LTLNNIETLKSRLGVTQDHWEMARFESLGFLFAFCINCGRIFSRLWYIQRQRMALPWTLG